jgi:hypothetical protein
MYILYIIYRGEYRVQKQPIATQLLGGMFFIEISARQKEERRQGGTETGKGETITKRKLTWYYQCV